MNTLDTEIEQLRQRAQALLGTTPAAPVPVPVAPAAELADAMRLLEELRVYQTELEIQNQDLKAAQLQTELAMRRYRRVFENLPLESVMIDAQGFILEANAVARKKFALHQQTALQRRSVYQLFTLDSRAALHPALSTNKDVARAPHCQLAASAGEALREVDAHVIALDPDAAHHSERLMVLVDRTFERQLATKHEEVSRSEARYRALFNGSKVPMLLVDPQDGAIVSANAAALQFYGYDAATLQGLPITGLNCLSVKETQTEMARARREQRGHFYFTHRLSDGREVPVEVHSGPIEMDGRTLLYSIVHDISERVLAQQRADASHALLTNLTDQVPGVLYQYRVAVDGSACFPYVSRGVETVYGLSAAQVQADAAAVFAKLHPQDAERVAASVAESARALSPWVSEYRVNLPGRGERWCRGVARPERCADGSTLWHGFTADITEHKHAEQKLEDFNRDFEAFLDQTSDFIYFKDRDSRFRFCSQTLANICQHADWRDMLGKHDLDVFPAETARIYQLEEGPVLEQGKPLLNRIDPYIDANGQRGYVHTNKWPLYNKAGHIAGIFGISRDVTDIRRNQAELQLAANVFTHAREGILIADAQGLIVEVNAAFTRITGYQRQEVLGQNPRMFKSGHQNPEFYARMWQSLVAQGHWEGEIWNRRKDGSVYAELLSISVVKDSDAQVQNYVALLSDISQQKAHEQELERIARYDVLTGLPNRVLLGDRLRQAIVQGQRRKQFLAVVFLDLDGFKGVNDTHGHAAGDALLIFVAQQLQATLREGDTLARIGGDEFVAVLADLARASDCEPILERMLQAAAAPVAFGEVELHVSASMGVTLCPQDGVEVDLLMRQADQAMYQAKLAGKHRFHLFDATQDAALRQQRESLAHIQRALQQGEFELYYQPKVHMRSGAVEGMEALIRWNHPQRGVLCPADFLGIIENQPLSAAVGDWVIHTALRQIRQWQAEGLQVPVSVNISAMQILQDDFAEQMRATLADFPGLNPRCLELEVLETSAFDDLPRVRATIAQCQQLGLTFALDDFGTGYSSLAYLKHLPVETLKIDRGFVRDMLDNPEDLAIVTGVIGLARAFGRHVIAEGVETLAQRERLLAMGCDAAQGYGIAMPMPAHRVQPWVAQWLADNTCGPEQPAAAPV